MTGVIPAREKFRLLYGVFLHAAPEGARVDLKAAYVDYIQLAGEFD